MRAVHRRVTGLILLAVSIAVLAAALQRPEPAAHFEFGQVRMVEGDLRLEPYPVLVTPGGEGGVTSFILVGRGKRGPQELVAGLDGRHVRVSATLAWRGVHRLLELEGPPADLGPARAAEAPMEDLGPVTLVGEVVDGKCNLGVMVPGVGATHRACAVRCLSGGAPPLLVAREPGGRSATFLLVTPEGRAPGREILPLVAEPIRLRGQAVRSGDLQLLVTDPSTWERVP
jgi:hypothetical protein